MKFIGIIPVRYASTCFPANGINALEDLVKAEEFLKQQEGRA